MTAQLDLAVKPLKRTVYITYFRAHSTIMKIFEAREFTRTNRRINSKLKIATNIIGFRAFEKCMGIHNSKNKIHLRLCTCACACGRCVRINFSVG